MTSPGTTGITPQHGQEPPLVTALENPDAGRTFAVSTEPLFSILIPCRNQWHLTRRALVAVADRTDPDTTPFEVILGDDGSDDATVTSEQEFTGLRRIVNDSGLTGFVGNVNRAARSASGEYLVLLNNDTEVQAGWLEAILETFRRHERVGIVGARLMYPDGRLQEAGCTVFRDGSTQNEGRFDDPRDPRYASERVCDYVSGACLAIPRELWNRVGGFDAVYAPAYCEDVDLALRVWAAGYSVNYQPHSLVVHLDGGTMQGTRQDLLERNRKRLVERWGDLLRSAADPNLGSLSEGVLARNAAYRLLFSHPARALWRRLPLRGSAKKALSSRFVAHALRPHFPARTRSGNTLSGRATVAGFLQSGLGQGEAARLDVEALHDLGFAPARLDVSPAFGLLDLPDRSFASTLIPPSGPMLIRVNGPELPIALSYIGRNLTDGRHIVGCWAWELPGAPGNWKAGYDGIDELWVPSEYCANAFRVSSPVEISVVPHPVRVPPSAARTRRDFGLSEDALIFLAMSDMRSSFDRKNLIGAITSFLDACGDSNRHQLVLKVHHVQSAPHNMRRVRQAIGKAGNIHVMDTLLSRAELGDLLRAADVFLSPHRAEGFGLVLAESMLLGKPVVATAFSGNTDFMPEGTAELLKFELAPVRDYAGVYSGSGQQWAEPDLAQCAEAIARLGASEAYRTRLGAAARAFASAYFSAESFGRRLSARFLQDAARF